MKNNSDTRCVLCGKRMGEHKATFLNCPVGLKTRVGYVQYSASDHFASKNVDTENFENKFVKMMVKDLKKIKKNKLPTDKVLGFLMEMANNECLCKNMTDKELHKASFDVWAKLSMETMDSCVLGELMKRFAKNAKI